MVRECFPNASQFPMRAHCFQCQFLFSRCKICLRYTAGNLSENPSMRALAKILRARASEHSSNFCEQFEQRLNFASTFKLDGTIRYPFLGEHTLGPLTLDCPFGRIGPHFNSKNPNQISGRHRSRDCTMAASLI